MALTKSRWAAKEKKRVQLTDSSYESTFAGSRSSESIATDWSVETPARSLRKRTMRQEHPFQADKVEHNLAKKGVKASESDLEDKLRGGSRKSKSSKHSMEPVKKKLKQHTRTRSTPSVSPEVASVDIAARTWLSGVTKAYIPVNLNVASTSELFDKMEQSWDSKLNGRKIDDCIVSFSWLEEDDNIFLLRSDDGTAYREIMKEARSGLRAKDKKGTINIHLSM